MFSVKFIRDALERAISTAAQALLGAGVVLGDYFSSTNLKIAGAAAIAAILKAIVATRVGDSESAGLV